MRAATWMRLPNVYPPPARVLQATVFQPCREHLNNRLPYPGGIRQTPAFILDDDLMREAYQTDDLQTSVRETIIRDMAET